MESDIVTRLHLWCNWHDAGFYDEIRNEIRQAIDEIERLRKERDELAARCGDHGPGAHTAGPVETFIPEAL